MDEVVDVDRGTGRIRAAAGERGNTGGQDSADTRGRGAFSRQTQWYSGLRPSELRKLRQLEKKNQKYKRRIAGDDLNKAMRAKNLRPRRRRIIAWFAPELALLRSRPFGSQNR